jgi:hypothetical protein
MGIHKTSYKTENGKTRKVKQPAKAAGKDGASEKTGANGNQQPGSPAK